VAKKSGHPAMGAVDITPTTAWWSYLVTIFCQPWRTVVRNQLCKKQPEIKSFAGTFFAKNYFWIDVSVQ